MAFAINGISAIVPCRPCSRPDHEPKSAGARSSDDDWAAALRGDRTAFEQVVSPHLPMLLDAARRELRYRIALGDLGTDDLTPEELVGEVLIRAWQDRQHRPAALSISAWLLALLFRAVKSLVRREARFRSMARLSLELPGSPEPVYDEDEGIWKWYQPDDPDTSVDVLEAPVMTPEDVAASDEQLIRGLDPKEREAFLLFELHRLPLREVAVGLGVSAAEAAQLIEDARKRLALTDDRSAP
jgi:RNA polymerase sigma factor (sigma-70 family)